MTQTSDSASPDVAKPDRPTIDPVTAQRLERLTQRRRAPEGAPTGSDTATARRVDERLAALRSRREEVATDGASARPRRRHPAQGARRAALGLSLVSTGGLAALFGLTGQPAAGTELAAAQITQVAASPAPTAATANAATIPASSDTTLVNGAVYENRWGSVQVRAVFDAGGALVDVTALQTPTGGKSDRINDYAVPRLTVEALTAQSAQVDTVSGATYTSTDYRRSLQSAIDVARAAGATSLV